MEKNSDIRFKIEWKIFIAALLIIIISDSIGTISIPTKIGNIVLLPMIFSILIGSTLGPDLFKLLNKDQTKMASNFVLIALAPFMAKMGISAGSNLARLVELGPALLLQEFGNLGTIIFSLPLAMMLGLGRQSIGATYSINRDSNMGLSADIFGVESEEFKGTFGVYIVGTVVGTMSMSIIVNLIAALDIFHPLALGMASGVGSGSMMAVGTNVVANLYPEFAEEILMLGGASDMLTGITGIYLGTFIGIPFARKYYKFLSTRIGKSKKQVKETNKEVTPDE